MVILGRIHSVLNKCHLLYLKFTCPNLVLGKNAKVDWKSNIDIGDNKLTIGANTRIRSLSKNYHVGMPWNAKIFIDVKDAKVEIGENCRIVGTFIHAQKEIIIGNNTLLGTGVNIFDSNGHEVNSADRTIGRDTPQPIRIGNNVWVGLNATILKGTTIGDNSIVTTGSVVKGHFPANVIIQGNPAVIAGNLNIK